MRKEVPEEMSTFGEDRLSWANFANIAFIELWKVMTDTLLCHKNIDNIRVNLLEE